VKRRGPAAPGPAGNPPDRDRPGERAAAIDVQLAPDGAGGTWLPVRAQPRARRSGLAGTWNGHLKVAVGAPPEGGRANEEVLRVLARALELSRSELELASGAHARNKRIRVALPLPDLRRRLLAALG